MLINPYHAKNRKWTGPSFNLDETIHHFYGEIKNIYALSKKLAMVMVGLFVCLGRFCSRQ
jgi:hypothetical protein